MEGPVRIWPEGIILQASKQCATRTTRCGKVVWSSTLFTSTLALVLTAKPTVGPVQPNPNGLLEIKCPHTAYGDDLTPSEACSLPDYCCELVNGQPRLRASHAYYYQVQRQLGVSGLILV